MIPTLREDAEALRLILDTLLLCLLTLALFTKQQSAI
jgi:hypothetical protein